MNLRSNDHKVAVLYELEKCLLNLLLRARQASLRTRNSNSIASSTRNIAWPPIRPIKSPRHDHIHDTDMVLTRVYLYLTTYYSLTQATNWPAAGPKEGKLAAEFSAVAPGGEQNHVNIERRRPSVRCWGGGCPLHIGKVFKVQRNWHPCSTLTHTRTNKHCP